MNLPMYFICGIRAVKFVAANEDEVDVLVFDEKIDDFVEDSSFFTRVFTSSESEEVSEEEFNRYVETLRSEDSLIDSYKHLSPEEALDKFRIALKNNYNCKTSSAEQLINYFDQVKQFIEEDHTYADHMRGALLDELEKYPYLSFEIKTRCLQEISNFNNKDWYSSCYGDYALIVIPNIWIKPETVDGNIDREELLSRPLLYDNHIYLPSGDPLLDVEKITKLNSFDQSRAAISIFLKYIDGVLINSNMTPAYIIKLFDGFSSFIKRVQNAKYLNENSSYIMMREKLLEKLCCFTVISKDIKDRADVIYNDLRYVYAHDQYHLKRLSKIYKKIMRKPESEKG